MNYGVPDSFAAIFGLGGLLVMFVLLVHEVTILLILLIPPYGWLATKVALVVKRWQASEQAFDSHGSHVIIEARASGLLSWLMTLLRIDPTSRLKVTTERVHLAKSSLAGKEHTFLPLENVCHTSYSYYRPWKKALLVYFIGWHIFPGFASLILPMMTSAITHDATLATISAVLGWLFGFLLSCGLAIVYFMRHKGVALGLEMESGKAYELQFRRSLIENRDIRADEVAYVAELLDYLCDNRRNRR